jgi:ribokinase
MKEKDGSMQICVIGSLNTDMVIRTQKYPKRGETIIGEKLDILPGGKGGNAATAIAKLGKEVMLIGCVGNDSFGDKLVAELEKNGVNISGIHRSDKSRTGTAMITIDAGAENTMLVVRGANDDLTPEDVDQSFPVTKDCSVLLTQMEVAESAIIHAMRKAKDHGMLVILDPAPAQGITMRAFQYADIIIPNEQETKYMTGIDVNSPEDAIQAATYFQSLGISRSIIKMGRRGCLVYTPERSEYIEAIPVKAVDTVVGDTFSGALAFSLADGKDLFHAARFASVVSALKVTRFGAQVGIPTLDEVNTFISKFDLVDYLKGKQKQVSRGCFL